MRSSTSTKSWQEENIDLGDLCCNDVDIPLRLSVFHGRSSGKHMLVGEVETSVNALIAASKSSSRLLISNKGIVTGAVIISKATIITGENENHVLGNEETTKLSLGESGIISDVSGEYGEHGEFGTSACAFIPPYTPTQSPNTIEGIAPGKLSKESSTQSMLFTSGSTIHCI